MKTSFNKTSIHLAVACALAMAAGAVQAQNLAPANEREIWHNASSQAWKNAAGECWHSAFGPPPAAGECNPAPIVAAAPVPAPYVAPYVAPVVVAAAAPQPVYEKVSLDADALFDFDKSTLRPAGRDALDGFVRGLKGINPAMISSEGHTDRFGSNGYNQDLSERRAAAVKAYLVSQGVDAGQVQVSGKGEMQPVTKSGDCRGFRNAKTLACLQADRRVEIEVTGSRLVQN